MIKSIGWFMADSLVGQYIIHGDEKVKILEAHLIPWAYEGEDWSDSGMDIMLEVEYPNGIKKNITVPDYTNIVEGEV